MRVHGGNILDRGDSKYKDSEVRASLACSRNIREDNVSFTMAGGQ